MVLKYGANTLPISIIIRLPCTLQMAYPRLELICCLYAYIEEVWWLKRSQAQIHHTIYSKYVFWRGRWAWQSLSSIVIYNLQVTYPRLEFIYRPHACIEEAWLWKPLISLIYHTIQALNVSWWGIYWFGRDWIAWCHTNYRWHTRGWSWYVVHMDA